MHTATRHRCIAMLVVLATGIGSSARSEAALTGAARLSAIYDEILGARFDRAHELIATACEPAPREACQALERRGAVVADRARSRRAAPSTRASRPRPATPSPPPARGPLASRTGPKRGSIWPPPTHHSCSGGSSEAIGSPRRATATGSGARSNARSPSIRRCTTRSSASASTTTTPTSHRRRRRSCGWLLLLPGGDRAQGLREMLEAREQGELLQGEADFQLHWLYLWYEQQPDRALALLRALDRALSDQPGLPPAHRRSAGRVLSRSSGQRGGVDRAARARAAGATSAARLAEVNARLGLGVELDAMFETDRAIDQFQSVVAACEPAAASRRSGAGAPAARRRATIDSAIAAMAVAAYDDAVRLAPSVDANGIRGRARAALGRRPDATVSAAPIGCRSKDCARSSAATAIARSRCWRAPSR